VMHHLLGFEEEGDDVRPLPEIKRADTTPAITGLMAKLDVEEKTAPRKSSGGLLRRMTTMRPKKKSIA
jgi:hypothetical protein